MLKKLNPRVIPENEIGKFPIFSSLSEEQLSSLCARARYFSCGKDEVVIRQGDKNSGVFVTLRGTVKVCALDALSLPEQNGRTTKPPIAPGGSLTLAICGRGDVLGEIEAADHACHSATVITKEPARFLWLSAEQFATAQNEIPQITRNLVTILAGRLRRMSIKAQALATLDVVGILACQLLLFAADQGVALDDGSIRLPLMLTQTDLAALVGYSRERVNRAMTELRRLGLVTEEKKHQLVIQDSEGLKLLSSIKRTSFS